VIGTVLDIGLTVRLIKVYAMLTSRKISKDLNGTPTDIVFQAFADRILVLVTQMGKIGTLVHSHLLAASIERCMANPA
jgi:hypothetical protein